MRNVSNNRSGRSHRWCTSEPLLPSFTLLISNKQTTVINLECGQCKCPLLKWVDPSAILVIKSLDLHIEGIFDIIGSSVDSEFDSSEKRVSHAPTFRQRYPLLPTCSNTSSTSVHPVVVEIHQQSWIESECAWFWWQLPQLSIFCLFHSSWQDIEIGTWIAWNIQISNFRAIIPFDCCKSLVEGESWVLVVRIPTIRWLGESDNDHENGECLMGVVWN